MRYIACSANVATRTLEKKEESVNLILIAVQKN